MESARTADAVSVDRHGSDRGSITPLAIGFVVIALLLAFLIAALTDLHMARRELQAVADSAALAASDSFEPAPGDDPGLVFSPDAAERATVRYVASVDTPDDLRNIGVDADVDGEHSVVIRLRADYIPAVLSPSFPASSTSAPPPTREGRPRIS
ncbi:hypothetical protein IOD13_11620 [Brevibacterium casei]|nr:hypothetical protein [Brevibacterium casei]